MGIPSYYTYLIKNYNQLIKKIIDFEKKVDHFYLDSNSIIYDCLHTKDVGKNIEDEIIKNVCLKIDEYINVIKPNNNIIIAFDGVAPVAKLEQQRNRRYKSDLESKIKQQLNPLDEKSWDTRAITPGTKFMKKLNKYIKNYVIITKLFRKRQ